MKTFFLTDKGKVREHNEDSVAIVKNKNSEILMIVADGMGGHKAGEVASSIAVNVLGKDFIALEKIGTKEQATNWLNKKIEIINNEIFSYTNDNPESKGMGTTVVLCLYTKDYILMGNIGDSSGYVLKDEELHKITYDHTLVNLLISTGKLTEEEALNHPKKSVLMRALGANDPIELDVFDVDQSVDMILLCSDGLTTMLDDEQINKVLNNDEELEDKVIKLIGKSNNRGGSDNISIACLITERGEQSDK